MKTDRERKSTTFMTDPGLMKTKTILSQLEMDRKNTLKQIIEIPNDINNDESNENKNEFSNQKVI
jgi:hypothetical protein